MYRFDPKVRMSAQAFGQAHGETFRGPIRELADIRIELAMRIGGFDSTAAVIDISEAHLPVLKGYDSDLYAELVGIAEGSGTTPAKSLP